MPAGGPGPRPLDTVPPWPRREIEDFVRGGRLLLCAANGRAMALPDWMTAVAGPVIDMTLAQALASAHPDDLGNVTAWFIGALARPGEATRIEVRFDLGGGMTREEVTLVNLVEHPEVGGMLARSRSLGPAHRDDVAGRPARPGEHDQVDWMLARMDHLGRVTGVEGKVRQLLGRSVGEVVGRLPMEFMHEDSVVDVLPMWIALLESPGNTASARRLFVHPDGTERWTECVYLNRFGPDGSGDVLMLCSDISARRAQEEALRRSHEEIRRLGEESRSRAEDFRLLADEVPVAVFRCDVHGTVTFHNARWAELVGAAPLGRLQDAVHPDDRPVLDAHLGRLVGPGRSARASTGGPGGPDDGGPPGPGDAPERLTFEVRAVDGERVLAVTLRSDADGDAALRHIIGSIDDVSATVRLRHEARRDGLTGLLNRKALDEALARALERDLSGTLVVFLDLDGFKAVNDSHGHDAGDAVLLEVGRRLAGAVRPGDAVGRYGGDEFVIVYGSLGPVDTAAITGRLRRALGGAVAFSGGSWEPAASIGTARPVPGEDLAAVVRRADLAMFEAKRVRMADRGALGPVADGSGSRRTRPVE
jgi:diguanylate cyclase (GGDEF)-like protein/PAS domain S-box-containing protein